VISDSGSVCRLRVRVVGPGFRRAGCEANGLGERMELCILGLDGGWEGFARISGWGQESWIRDGSRRGGMEGGFGIAISWNGLGEEAAASLERGRT